MKGKGVYLWNTIRIVKDKFDGRPKRLALNLREAGVAFVAIKIVNAAYVWKELEPIFLALQNQNIITGAWGYSYLNGAWGNSATAEANATLKAIRKYKPAFYLLDVEGHLRWQFSRAATFARIINEAKLNIPIGLNSYALPKNMPSYMYPWKDISACCGFICPQVYWRTSDPVQRLQQSRAQYAAVIPKLGIPLVAGDMYFENGIRPSPEEIKQFLEFCKKDPEIKGALMWSYDQKFTEPALWKAFSEVLWPTEELPDPPPIPASPVEQAASLAARVLAGTLECNKAISQIDFLLKTVEEPPLPVTPIWVGAVNVAQSSKLNIRSSPSVLSKVIGKLSAGERVEIWKERFAEKRLWLKVSETKSEWVAAEYVKRI